MKKIYKNFLFGTACVICSSSVAQVSAYFFAQSNGTYTPITGGTVIATATANTAPGNLASMVWNLPNGTFSFPFIFNGTAYTGCNISTNGFITFGAVAPATTLGTPISSTTAYDGVVCAWGRTTHGGFNLGTAAPFYTSELRVQEIGTAPNRTIVIQYDNWRYASGTGTTVWLEDYQIRLHETTNVVEIVYGPGVMAGGSLSTSGFNAQVGLRGLTNADFNNRSSFGLFDQSTAGTANNATQVIGVTSGVGVFMPPNGLTYRWYPSCNSGVAVTPTITANTFAICESDTLKFGASGETPFYNIMNQWQISTNPGGPYSNVTGPPAGTTFASYNTQANTPGVFYYVLVAACPTNSTSAMSNEIAVQVMPLPIINILATPALNTSVSPIETCFGETYTLVATGAASYTWTGGPISDTYVVQPSGNPTYLVAGTSIDGCIATRTLDIQVNPLPNITTLSSPNAVCPGKPAVIGASGNAVTYTWSVQNSNAFLITVTPTTSTIYTVTGTAANGCTSTAMQQVIVHNVAPLVLLSSVTGTICKGEEITLSVTGALSYTWATPTSFTLGQLLSATPDVTTTYTVTGTNLAGCVTQTTITQAVAACAGLSESTEVKNHLSIYPNPNNGVFICELNNGAGKIFEVIDMTGRMVLSTISDKDKTELSIDGLANGIYYVRVHSNNSVQVVKFVKQ